MKVQFYIFSWLSTLLVGLLLGAVFMQDLKLPLLFTGVAAVVSAPFIALFCILMSLFLKRKPSISALHSRTFIFHSIGSILTALVLTIAFGGAMPAPLYLAILGYFIIDSIFFHLYIQAKHPIIYEKTQDNSDILDHPL